MTAEKVDQHMVSKCLIQNWCEIGSEQVEYLDLRDGPRYRRAAPSQVMYRRSDNKGQGFVPVAYAAELEQSWGVVEKKARDAIQAVLSRTLIDDERRQAILDLMALHLLRSSEVLGRFLALQGEAANQVYDDVALSEEFKQILVETGMSLDEAEGAADAGIRAPDGLIQHTRKTFAETLPRWLDRYRAELASCGLILRKSETGGLMLGDGPAFISVGTCLECETTAVFGMLDRVVRCRLHAGVSAFWPRHDWYCWMPLSPEVVAQASPRVKDCDEMLRCFESQVDNLNKMQCRRAQFRVVIPAGSKNRSEPIVRQHAEDRHPRHSYKKAGTPPQSERWNH